MLNYSTADLGAEAPEADTTTHVCGCGQCAACAPAAWRADLRAARTSDEQAAVWQQIHAAHVAELARTYNEPLPPSF